MIHGSAHHARPVRESPRAAPHRRFGASIGYSDDGAVEMKAHPVVREILRPASTAAACRGRSALQRPRAPGPSPEPSNSRRASRCDSQLPGESPALLECVAGGGLLIETETSRPHHEHRRGTLRFLARTERGPAWQRTISGAALHCPVDRPRRFHQGETAGSAANTDLWGRSGQSAGPKSRKTGEPCRFQLPNSLLVLSFALAAADVHAQSPAPDAPGHVCLHLRYVAGGCQESRRGRTVLSAAQPAARRARQTESRSNTAAFASIRTRASGARNNCRSASSCCAPATICRPAVTVSTVDRRHRARRGGDAGDVPDAVHASGTARQRCRCRCPVSACAAASTRTRCGTSFWCSRGKLFPCGRQEACCTACRHEVSRSIRLSRPARNFRLFTHFWIEQARRPRQCDRHLRLARKRIGDRRVPLHRAAGRRDLDRCRPHVVPAHGNAGRRNRAPDVDVSVRRDQSRTPR